MGVRDTAFWMPRERGHAVYPTALYVHLISVFYLGKFSALRTFGSSPLVMQALEIGRVFIVHCSRPTPYTVG